MSVSTPIDDEARGKPHADCCADCGASLAAAQRYCMECGSRRGPLPPVVGERVAALRERGRPASASDAAVAAPAAVASAAAAEDAGLWRFMPSPQVAAVAVMALLAAGVVIGSVTSPLASSAGFAPIILQLSSPGPASAPEEEEPEATVSEAPEPAPVVPAAEAPVPLPSAPLPVEPEPESPPPLEELPELEEPTLPEVKHVFLIVLQSHGYEEAFGKTSTSPYFSQELAAQGELLPNYFAVTQGALANEVALLSGQGPTPETAANCPEYKAIVPATVGTEEQVEGSGCVYPSTTQSLPSQMATAGMTWKAYVEDIANGEAAGQPATCRHPAPEAADPSQAPLPGDAYLTWRNPFVYFSALTEGPECAADDVGLDKLTADLKTAKKTPTLSYIVPNACHDGGETPCAPEQPAGLAGAEGFLKTVVPQIAASDAYEEGGLIAITFDQAPQQGPSADSSSCCATPEYPNLPAPASAPAPPTGPVKPSGGGGQVGLLLISPFVEAGSIDETGYYNHFALLRSIEELLGLPPLGYAAGPALTSFDSTVFNAPAQSPTSSASCRDCASRAPSALHSSPSSSKKPWRARPELKTAR